MNGPKDVYKRQVSNCMHPDDRAMVYGEIVRQLAERGEYMVEYRMKRRDGSYIWVHDLGRGVIAENGKPAIISVCIDITAQKKAQAEVVHLYNNCLLYTSRCVSETGIKSYSGAAGSRSST